LIFNFHLEIDFVSGFKYVLICSSSSGVLNMGMIITCTGASAGGITNHLSSLCDIINHQIRRVLTHRDVPRT
jgi:hypothetical protein